MGTSRPKSSIRPSRRAFENASAAARRPRTSRLLTKGSPSRARSTSLAEREARGSVLPAHHHGATAADHPAHRVIVVELEHGLVRVAVVARDGELHVRVVNLDDLVLPAARLFGWDRDRQRGARELEA